MSTEQVDPELVEQTKQQIRALVAEIQQLARSDCAPGEFYGGFLDRVVQALAAFGGAVWAPGEESRLQLQYQVNLQKTGLAGDEEGQVKHGRLLQKVMSTGEGLIVQPHSGPGGDDEGSNTTEFLLVLCALKADQEVRGVVEVFQRADTRPNTQRGYLRFLAQMCDLASEFLNKKALRSFTDRQQLWGQLEQFTRMAHASLDPRETAYTIANEARRLIGCDRVSVAIRRGRKCAVEAVSGQDMLDKRSNQVTLLGALATAVVRSGDKVWYTGDTSDMPPQVEEAVQAYVDESHSKTVAVIPLQRPKLDESETAGEAPITGDEPFGALIVEQIESARIREGMLERVDVVGEHSSTALGNALEYHSLFLLPLWKTLGKATWVVKGRTLPKTLAIVGAILAAILGLVIVPWDFELEGPGKLQPVVMRDVFADEMGTVMEVKVKHAADVQQNDLLALLRNTDVELQIKKTSGDLATAQQDFASYTRAFHESRDKTEKEQLAAKIETTKSLVATHKHELDLLNEKKTRMEVRSPITGVVVTSWDQIENLLQRPVKRGDVLLHVADTSQEWELEVLMPEDRMGHIVQAQKDLGPDLKVEYVLATDPDVQRYGTVRETHYAAEVRGEEGNTVKMSVAIDKQDLVEADLLRPGATVTARVYCGRRSVGYVLFHDLFAWIQTRILFRFF